MDKRYMHKETGSVDTREGWIASYDVEELARRGLTAEKAFSEDEGRTLIETDEPTEDERRAAAAMLGRKGGQAKSEAKAAAVRANGALGGRPVGPRYTLIRNTMGRERDRFEGLTARDLYRLACKLYPDHEWPEDASALYDEVAEFDPQGLEIKQE